MSLTVFPGTGSQWSRYLLLYPDPSLVGKVGRHLKQTMEFVDYGLFAMPYGTSQEVTTEDVERGTLHVRVVRYVMRRVKHTSIYHRGG